MMVTQPEEEKEEPEAKINEPEIKNEEPEKDNKELLILRSKNEIQKQ